LLLAFAHIQGEAVRELEDKSRLRLPPMLEKIRLCGVQSRKIRHQLEMLTSK
jgi:hypothetical protein